MNKTVLIIVIISVLLLSTGGLLVIHFQDTAQLAKTNSTVNSLAHDMESMRATPAATSSQGTNLADLVTAVNPAVVRIDVTGSIVDQSGYVLTNQHVIDNSTSIKVTLSTSDAYAATVVASDSNRDLAILKMTSTRTDFPIISLGTASDAQVGDNLIVAGFPLGIELTGPASFTNGIVSALRTIDGLDYIQTNAAIDPGNSGGPIFNDQGLLVGMVVASVTSTNVTNVQGLGLGIPVADILKFIDSGQVACSDCHFAMS
jgi:S1-C subfamily serine protease